MLVASTLFLVGVGALHLARQRWDLTRGGLLAVPLFVVYALWDLTAVPAFLLGVGIAFGALSAGDGRWRTPRPRNWALLFTAGAVGPVVVLVASVGIPAGTLGDLAFLGAVLPAVVWCARALHDGRWRDVGIGLLGGAGLAGVGVVALWQWLTPPVVSHAVFGVSVVELLPAPLVPARAADAVAVPGALVRALPVDGPLAALSLVATAIGSLVFVYVLASMAGHVLYTARRGVKRVDDLTLVLVTVATEDVRDALFEAVEHNRRLFEDYDFRVLIDEGAPLQSELAAMGVDCVVVPDDYDPAAVAKGRAMQYFVENHVAEDEWYAFLDDDNLVQGREFLYEIPRQEAAGNLVMNPVLLPRRGASVVAFAIDHMRTLFDFTVFRTFTGLLGRPYAGLHGELLCARGDVLREVGFDRPTIVEDFAFADELVRRGVGTWQSQTTTSILSPHTLEDYFTQRTRWFVGKVRWLPRSSPGTVAVTAAILGVWGLGIFGGWLVGGVWFLFGPPAQVVYLLPALLSSGLYGAIYGMGVLRAGGRHLPKVLLVPVYATVEHVAPYYALLRRSTSFEVIKK